MSSCFDVTSQVALTLAAIQYGRAADVSESRELLDEAERSLGRHLDRCFLAMYNQAVQVGKKIITV